MTLLSHLQTIEFTINLSLQMGRQRPSIAGSQSGQSLAAVPTQWLIIRDALTEQQSLDSIARSRRGGGWNWVGVVSGLSNPNDSGVRALERRPRHDEGYHEGGGCGRRSFAFG